MITFNKFILDNGLKVIVHEDRATPFVVMNILYNVGARDEDPDKTGFAHLFEHLMFGGSANIPRYDEPLERAGGKSNAFTNNDITNYYDIIPANNIEVAFWLESDRMLGLAFSERSLKVQKKVVCEEFKEHYINQPYGDIWHLLSDLSYKVHPYRWPTIGKELSHIENAVLDDVKEFFYKYYRPNNAILIVAGNVQTKAIKKLSEKWFGDIPPGDIPAKDFPAEPTQTEPRQLNKKADVPVNAILKSYHMYNRKDSRYYAADLMTDILSNGDSSRLMQSLVKEQKLFSEVSAFATERIDGGQIILEGMLNKGVKMEQAEKSILVELDKLSQDGIEQKELQKVQNKAEAALVRQETTTMAKAMGLAYFELLGDAKQVNAEITQYLAVSTTDIKNEVNSIFQPSNCSTLYYYAK